jgi:hypothetical protein
MIGLRARKQLLHCFYRLHLQLYCRHGALHVICMEGSINIYNVNVIYIYIYIYSFSTSITARLAASFVVQVFFQFCTSCKAATAPSARGQAQESSRRGQGHSFKTGAISETGNFKLKFLINQTKLMLFPTKGHKL